MRWDLVVIAVIGFCLAQIINRSIQNEDNWSLICTIIVFEMLGLLLWMVR